MVAAKTILFVPLKPKRTRSEHVANQLARFRGRGSNPLSNINQKHLRFQLMSVHMSYMIPMEISHAWFVRTNPYSQGDFV